MLCDGIRPNLRMGRTSVNFGGGRPLPSISGFMTAGICLEVCVRHLEYQNTVGNLIWTPLYPTALQPWCRLNGLSQSWAWCQIQIDMAFSKIPMELRYS